MIYGLTSSKELLCRTLDNHETNVLFDRTLKGLSRVQSIMTTMVQHILVLVQTHRGFPRSTTETKLLHNLPAWAVGGAPWKYE